MVHSGGSLYDSAGADGSTPGIDLKKAGVPVEMPLYAQGGHAFGLRRTKLPVRSGLN
jgi:hypothetical protein